MEFRRSRRSPTEGGASFGERLRRLRLANGLTQRELAERAGVSLRGLNALESGRHQAPRARTIARLAEALGFTADDRAVFEAAGRGRAAGGRILELVPPPPAAAAASVAPGERPYNLPLPPTALLGREREQAELMALLRRDDARLVTLTGPGGVGKTRLALEVARTLRDDGEVFPDGVWLVRLAPLTDHALVIPSVAQALGLSETGATPIANTLRATLRDKVLLLLLDNFEHVAAAAPKVAELLAWSPGLKLLVTSRAPLRLRSERNYPVSLLAMPPSAAAQGFPAQRLDEYAATALFVQRARAAQPGFQASDTTAPLIAAICARLDGLPLAIELAAARARLLPPAALLARLERQLPLLTGGPLDLPERQRTMGATIAWSYDLLGAEEQCLFRRLAVFADGCALVAAEAVCQAPAGASPLALDALEGLGRLVDQSLISQQDVDGEPRFGMLHVIREFALARLEASGEAEALRHAHARYYTDLAEAMEPELRGQRVAVWLELVERELGNVRAALDWARASGEIELGLRLATALWRFWFEGGYLSEGLQWIEALLAQADAASLRLPGGLRARAAATAGLLAAVRRDAGRAVIYLEQAITLGRAADEWLALAIGLEMRGAVLRLRGDLEGAASCFEEALAVGRAHGDALSTYTPLASLGEVARNQGDLALAAARYREALDVSRAAGHQSHVALMLRRLAELALSQGENQRAARLLRESAGLYQTFGKPWALVFVFELLAVAYAREGRAEQAARLLGGAARLRESAELPYVVAEQAEIEALVAPVRAALSVGAWAEAFAAGHALTLEEMAAEAQRAAPEARDDVARNDAATAAPAGASGGAAAGGRGARTPHPADSDAARGDGEWLTRRELEVLRLLAEGLSDAQIAERLVISVRTVNHHVAAIYDKLGVSSRAAATRAALDGRLL